MVAFFRLGADGKRSENAGGAFAHRYPFTRQKRFVRHRHQKKFLVITVIWLPPPDGRAGLDVARSTAHRACLDGQEVVLCHFFIFGLTEKVGWALPTIESVVGYEALTRKLAVTKH